MADYEVVSPKHVHTQNAINRSKTKFRAKSKNHTKFPAASRHSLGILSDDIMNFEGLDAITSVLTSFWVVFLIF